MIDATGRRIGWADLPHHVRTAVEQILGSEVATARSQPGGFSPGSADRVVTTSGKRAFVKAVSPAQNPVSPGMHRREAEVTAALPAGTPAPKLLGHYDDGNWIALVLEDIEGRHPKTPWVRNELDAVMETLDAMATLLTPAPIDGLPAAGDVLAGNFAGWRRIAENPPPDLDPWAAAHLAALVTTADQAATAVAGDTLVHLDIRADNLLIGPSGTLTVVDWPAAGRGARWLDRVLLLIDVGHYGGHDCDGLLRTIDGDDDAKRSVLVALAGFFLDRSRDEPPPGLPTVRAFQRAQGDALLAWLAEG